MAIFKLIPLSEITPDPNQPRKFFDPSALTELTESIIANGVIQPILIRPIDAGYMLVYGERRYRASVDAGITEIPAIIRDMTDVEALEIQIIENLQRRDVHPIEEATAFAQLHDRYTIDEIAQRVGKNPKYVQQRIRLTTLSDKAQQLFYEDCMTIKQALVLANIDKVSQDEIINIRVVNRQEGTQWNIGNIDFMIDNKIKTLDDTHFDPLDPHLYPDAGACTTCPYNTANTPTLFEDTSPSCAKNPCYQIKSERHLDMLLSQCNQETFSIGRKLHQRTVPTYKGVVLDWYTYEYRSTYDTIKPLLARHDIPIHLDKNIDMITPPDPILTAEQWADMEDYFSDVEDEEDIDYKDAKFMRQYVDYVSQHATDTKIYQDKGKDSMHMLYIDSLLRTTIVYVDLPQATTISMTNEIDAKIVDLNIKERRAKELDAEKLYGNIMDAFLNENSDYHIAPWIHKDLSDIDRKIACAMLYHQLHWSVKKEWSKDKMGSDYPDQDTLVNYFFGGKPNFIELIKLFISSCIQKEGSIDRSIHHYASFQLVADLYPVLVTDCSIMISEKATKRQTNLQAKIDSLRNT
jgi:ParB/RepB/Spo0J family partition protein